MLSCRVDVYGKDIEVAKLTSEEMAKSLNDLLIYQEGSIKNNGLTAKQSLETVNITISNR